MGRLTGLDQAVSNLSAVRAALRSEAALEPFQEAGDAVADRAKTLAPKVSGRLADSISAEAYEKDGVPAVMVSTRDVDYASDIEFGNHRQAAEPFMRPAGFEAGPTLESQIGEGLDKVVKGAVR